MKKLFALVVTLCLIATAFCIPAFAAEEEAVRIEFGSFGFTSTGSIFGNGSLAMIVAILALAASVFSIFLTLYLYKKKDDPQTKKDDAEDEE